MIERNIFIKQVRPTRHRGARFYSTEPSMQFWVQSRNIHIHLYHRAREQHKFNTDSTNKLRMICTWVYLLRMAVELWESSSDEEVHLLDDRTSAAQSQNHRTLGSQWLRCIWTSWLRNQPRLIPEGVEALGRLKRCCLMKTLIHFPLWSAAVPPLNEPSTQVTSLPIILSYLWWSAGRCDEAHLEASECSAPLTAAG